MGRKNTNNYYVDDEHFAWLGTLMHYVEKYLCEIYNNSINDEFVC